MSENTDSDLLLTRPENTAACAAGGSVLPVPVLVIRGEREHGTGQFPPVETDKPVINHRGHQALEPVPRESAASNIALVDFLGFTIPPAEGRDLGWLRETLHTLFHIPANAWEPTGYKWSGYTNRINLATPVYRGESRFGLVAYGGQHQKGTMHVSLSGQGCKLITDWQAVAAFLASADARLTRCDLAHDDFEAKTVTMKKAVDWYHSGGFNSGGRKPKHTVNGDWLDPESPDGLTLNIGKREYGKFTRIYEKGKEQGDTKSPWIRAETEWRNKDRHLPIEMLTQPGKYLAGAHPCFGYLSLEQDKVKTIRKTGTIAYDQMVKHLRIVAGKAVGVMMEKHQGNAAAVVQQLVREGVPRRLKAVAAFLPDVLNMEQADVALEPK